MAIGEQTHRRHIWDLGSVINIIDSKQGAVPQDSHVLHVSHYCNHCRYTIHPASERFLSLLA